MKIFLLSTPWISLPPIGYGGTERVVYNLSETLRRKGHEVLVATTNDSHISSPIVYYYAKALGIPTLSLKSHLFFLLNHVYAMLKEVPKDFDIVHNHCEYAAMYLLDGFPKKFVHTLHGAFYSTFDEEHGSKDRYTEAVRDTLHMFAHQPFVSISDDQRNGMTTLNYVGTVYNGIDVSGFTFQEKPSGDYLCWLGRFSPLKGLQVAIDAAKKTGKVFKAAGYVSQSRKELFDVTISPYIDNSTIIWEGELSDEKQKNDLMGNAKAFLFPILWEEPFGLVMVESMATGTPVIAFARGSAPEVIVDGETGFLVNYSDQDIRGNYITKKTGHEGFYEAIERIYSMSDVEYQKMRKNCRARVEAKFTVDQMAGKYLSVYEKILSSK